MTVYSAGLVTGAIWLILGLSGAATHIAKLVPRFVVIGIVLGLGFSFMIEGIKLMSTEWLIAAIGLLGTLLLLTNRAIPAMFLLLLFGAVCGVIQDPLWRTRWLRCACNFGCPALRWRRSAGMTCGWARCSWRCRNCH